MRIRTALMLSAILLVNALSSAAVPPPPSATGPAAPGSTSLKDLKELEARHLASDPETWPGAAVYRDICSKCHQGQVPKAPHKMFLQMMSPDVIL
ncbi:MAG: hypothetical protein JOY91_14145, partial [Sinobacteraceae bacterium]|nr:hypothetical protein [Nevskiaceae bacterium]